MIARSDPTPHDFTDEEIAETMARQIGLSARPEIGKRDRGGNNKDFKPHMVAPHAHHLVVELLRQMNVRKITNREMGERSGVTAGSIYHWSRGGRPRVDMIESCFEVMGYKLTIERVK